MVDAPDSPRSVTDKTKAPTIAVVDEIIRFRAIIARYGEPDQMGWWTHDTLQPDSGMFVAKRLFPRTYQWAAIELATAALTMHDSQRLNHRSAITLFILPPSLERIIDLRLRELKRSSESLGTLLNIDIFNTNLPKFTDALSCIPDTYMAAEKEPIDEAAGTLLRLGKLSGLDFTESEKIKPIVRKLTRAYGRSPRGALAIPYYAINHIGGHL